MGRYHPWIATLVVLVGTPAWAQQRTTRVQVASSVSKILVYSTRARVFRQATVVLRGAAQEVALADLPSAALQDTLRVESKTAKVVRVEVIQARGRLPRQVKARELVKKIEAASDRQRLVSDEQQILQNELALINSLSLRQPPSGPQGRANVAEGLFTDAWKQILDWMDARTRKVNSRLAQLASEHHALNKTLFALQVEARELAPASSQRLVPRVVATLSCARPGKHTVEISYGVGGVRWVPSYDLRYDPRSRKVEAAYYAVVNQTSGEDWDKAALRFSTGQPTRVVAIPELPTWTLGRKRDFTPTPSPRLEPAVAHWVPPIPLVMPNPMMILLARLARGPVLTRGYRGEDGHASHGFSGLSANGRLRDARKGKKMMPPAKPRPAPVITERPQDSNEHDDREPEESAAESSPDHAQALAPPPAPGPMPGSARVRRTMADMVVAKESGGSYFRRQSTQKPVVNLPWTDAGYRPPTLHPDLPAAAAKGYIFTLYAPGRHSVAASGTSRRIPLLRKSLKVVPTYRIIPGRSKRAYLMATVKNTTGRPILRGHANLFSGAMFSGRSWLNTALPGRTIKLPLGVDEAVKVERHLRQKTLVKGVFFKDDVTRYTVQIEIANHHKRAIEVELQDQVPVIPTWAKKLEIKEVKLPAGMTQDKKTGQVTWKGSVKGSSVKKLSFSFNIVRPKDWEMRQHGG